MTPVLIAAFLVYGGSGPAHSTYQLQGTFNGFLPILGGNEGKAAIDVTVKVDSEQPEKDGTLRFTHELKEAKILFNDEPLPLGLDAFQSYFPKTTVVVNKLGVTLSTTAPDIEVPVKLPGLDIKRFADIVYLPVSFPEKRVSAGDSWTFSRKFGAGDVTYTCVLNRLSDGDAEIGLKVRQIYKNLEDETLEIVADKDRESAWAETSTVVEGAGTANLDRRMGLFTQFELKMKSVTDVVVIKTKERSQRKLDIELKSKRSG
ncbi:MAG: hypothetical protein JST40_09185 [Armatimonadetes bacterium]|nr:hypothetical protein [Armatimonadota bacterium]